MTDKERQLCANVSRQRQREVALTKVFSNCSKSTRLETRVLHFVEKELTRVGFLLVEQRRV